MIEFDAHIRLGAFDLEATFELPAGITALFGRSGSGKSTVLAMIAGLHQPAGGVIRIGKNTLFDSSRGINLPLRQRHVALVGQNSNLFPHLTVRRNLTYADWAAKRRGRFNLNRVCKILGIEHLMKRRPATLSGGEKQRVAIGRALLSDPEILLLDEPLSALDIKRKLEILPFLEHLRDEFAIPMIYVSHSVYEVTRLADHLVVMEEGRMTACGGIEEVLSTSDIRGSGEGLEAGSLLTGLCTGFDVNMGLASLDIGGQQITLPMRPIATGTRVRVRIKANDVALALKRPQDISIQNMMSCVITGLEQVGPSHVLVGLKLGEQQIRARITQKAAADLALANGTECIALLKAVALEGHDEGSAHELTN